MGFWKKLLNKFGGETASTRSPSSKAGSDSVDHAHAPVVAPMTPDADEVAEHWEDQGPKRSPSSSAGPLAEAQPRSRVVKRSNPVASQVAAPNRMGSRPTEHPARRINIGLDFGTSTTKVVVRIDETASRPRFLVVGPSTGTQSVLFPAAVAISDDELLFGHAAEKSRSTVKVQSFKMNLPAEAGSRQHEWRGRLQLGDTGISAADLSTLYLAWVLNDVLAQVRAALGGMELKVTVNSAAPLDQMQEEQSLKELFHKIVFRAMKISHLASNPWKLASAKGALQAADEIPTPTDEDSPVSVFPETHAAMTSYMLLPGRKAGNYATVDVGAGSTDVSFFWFHATDGQPEMCYYGALSEFVGMDDMDQVLAPEIGKAQHAVRKERESGKVDIGRHTAGPLNQVFNRIFRCYRMGFGRSYARCKGELMWRDKNGHARYTLCLVGGGCLCPELVEQLSKALPILNMTSVDVELLRVPNELPVLLPGGRQKPIRQLAPGEQPLLLLAHGLANRAVDIPIYETGFAFERVRVLQERPSHEDLYAR